MLDFSTKSNCFKFAFFVCSLVMILSILVFTFVNNKENLCTLHKFKGTNKLNLQVYNSILRVALKNLDKEELRQDSQTSTGIAINNGAYKALGICILVASILGIVITLIISLYMYAKGTIRDYVGIRSLSGAYKAVTSGEPFCIVRSINNYVASNGGIDTVLNKLFSNKTFYKLISSYALEKVNFPIPILKTIKNDLIQKFGLQKEDNNLTFKTKDGETTKNVPRISIIESGVSLEKYGLENYNIGGVLPDHIPVKNIEFSVPDVYLEDIQISIDHKRSLKKSDISFGATYLDDTTSSTLFSDSKGMVMTCYVNCKSVRAKLLLLAKSTSNFKNQNCMLFDLPVTGNLKIDLEITWVSSLEKCTININSLKVVGVEGNINVDKVGLITEKLAPVVGECKGDDVYSSLIGKIVGGGDCLMLNEDMSCPFKADESVKRRYLKKENKKGDETVKGPLEFGITLKNYFWDTKETREKEQKYMNKTHNDYCTHTDAFNAKIFNFVKWGLLNKKISVVVSKILDNLILPPIKKAIVSAIFSTVAKLLHDLFDNIHNPSDDILQSRSFLKDNINVKVKNIFNKFIKPGIPKIKVNFKVPIYLATYNINKVKMTFLPKNTYKESTTDRYLKKWKASDIDELVVKPIKDLETGVFI